MLEIRNEWSTHGISVDRHEPISNMEVVFSRPVVGKPKHGDAIHLVGVRRDQERSHGYNHRRPAIAVAQMIGDLKNQGSPRADDPIEPRQSSCRETQIIPGRAAVIWRGKVGHPGDRRLARAD